MIASVALQQAIADLIAADTATLAAVLGTRVKLAKAAFTPSRTLDVATLTEADFTGYTAKTPTAGVQNVYVDPVTGLITVGLVAPVGGWNFETTGVGNLPQTIYGWYVTNSAGTVLYGSGLLTTPIPLTASGQGFEIPPPIFAFSNNSPN